MQRSPALVVPSVDVAPALHQELDHLCVLINAGLPHGTRDTIKTLFTAGIAAQFRQRTNLFQFVMTAKRQSHSQNLLNATEARG